MSTAPTFEPFCVSDTFVTGAAQLQFIGDNLRLTLFVAQRSTYEPGTENAVVAKLVGSRADMLQIAAAILRGCSGEDSFGDFLDAPAGRQ